MARFKRYRPYGSRHSSARRSRLTVITLLIIVAGLIILIQTRRNEKEAQASALSIPEVPLADVLPDSDAVDEAAVEMPSSPEKEAAAASVPVQSPAAEILEALKPAEVRVETPANISEIADAAGETAPEAKVLIDQAVEARKKGEVVAARDLLGEALKSQLSTTVRDEIKKQLSLLSQQWLFSGDVLRGDTLTERYRVASGELLTNIGKKYKVPYQFLMNINGIQRPERLQADQMIKAVKGPFNAVVNRTTFTMDLYLQDKYVKTYRVGIGMEGRETPTGLWKVTSDGKLVKPTWTDPDTGRTYIDSDPDYPLGSRWIALEGVEGNAKGQTGFAIHGTKDPETIGTRSSRGCIRLFNGDVIEVFNLLEGGQSLVQVID